MSMPTRPTLLAGRSFAVAGAMLLGAAALMLFGWSSQNWLRVLIVLVLFAVGIAVNGNRTDDEDDPVTRALGGPVKTGIGAAATFLGAYLAGPLILSFTANADQPPSSTVVLLLVYGFPLLALLRFVTRGMAVGTIGGAVVVPLLIALLMAQSGASAATVAVVSVVIALTALVTVLALPRDWAWAEPFAVFGGMAASFAVGAGTFAAGSLTGTAEPGQPGMAAVPSAPQVVVLVLGLLIAIGVVLVALARHFLAAGLVAASALAVPPTALLINPFSSHDTASHVVLVAVPGVVTVLAAVALVVPATRRLARLALPPHLRPARPVVGASALRAMIGVALLVAAQAIPLLGFQFYSLRFPAVLAAVLVAAAAVLAWFVPSGPGAVLAASVLVGLQLNQPWWRTAFAWGTGGTRAGETAVAVIGLVVTAGAAVALVWRHRRPAVFAAAAYALAGAIATMLAAVWEHSDDALLVSPLAVNLRMLAWLVGPLVLQGIPAAVAALRGRAVVAAQAVGTVVLTAGGFALALLLLPPARTMTSYVGLAPLLPTVPWSVPVGPAVPETRVYWVAALAMLVIAVALLVSTVRRPSTALAVAGVFVVAQCAATCLAGVADSWQGSSVTKLIVVVLIVAAVVAFTAVELLRRQDVVVAPPESTPTAP